MKWKLCILVSENTTCYSCGKSGHMKNECPTSAGTNCYNCGETGHMARDCKRGRSDRDYDRKRESSTDRYSSSRDAGPVSNYQKGQYEYTAWTATPAAMMEDPRLTTKKVSMNARPDPLTNPRCAGTQTCFHL